MYEVLALLNGNLFQFLLLPCSTAESTSSSSLDPQLVKNVFTLTEILISRLAVRTYDPGGATD